MRGRGIKSMPSRSSIRPRPPILCLVYGSEKSCSFWISFKPSPVQPNLVFLSAHSIPQLPSFHDSRHHPDSWATGKREREDVHTGSGGEDRRSGGPAILADCDPRCAAAHSAPPSAPTATCATPPPAYRFAVGPAKLYRCSIVTLLAPPCPVVPPHHPLRSHRLPFASRLESTRSDAYLAVLFFILFFPSRG